MHQRKKAQKPIGEAKVRWIKFAVMLCLLGSAMVGCGAHIKPRASDTRLDTAPSIESIGEFLDLIEFNDLLNRVVSAEKGVLEEKFVQSRARSCSTAKQASLCDEFIGKAMSVVEDTFSRENMRGIFNDTIRRSFTQRDIDALIFFYGTQSGKAILTELKMAIRPYLEARTAQKETIGLDSEHDRQNQLAAFFHLFNEAADTHEMSQFYGSDIDDDIKSRLPNARNIYDGEVDPLEAVSRARLRELIADYRARFKAVSST
jgi:hypothetical protein